MSFFDKLSKIFPIPSGSTNSKEYFFALNIESKEVEAAVWGIEDKHLNIISSSRKAYKPENLVETANFALDEALADFPIEPTKILFGVPDSWLLDDNLKDEYLEILRNLVKELDVTPLAYVSTSHAISHLLQKQQGVPITAVLINFSNPLNVAVVKAGKIVGSKTVKRSESLPEDIEKGLLGFTEVEVLPSKLLIFGADLGQESIEKLKDELHSYPWMQNLPFLHLPKIEFLEDVVGIAATCFAGATEIEADVNFSEKSLANLEKQILVDQSSIHTHNGQDLLDKDSDNLKKVTDADLGKVGFKKGDISKEDIEVAKDEGLEIDEEQLEATTSNFRQQNIEQSPELYLDDRNTKLPVKIPTSLGLILSKPNAIIKNLNFFFPKKGLILPVAALLILFLAYLFLPKAQVTVFIDPKILENSSQVEVDPKITEVDEVNKKIPGKIVETTLTGKEVGQATGKKKIGDPAKGAVLIYNKTFSSKTFSQGTILVGSDNLEFTLDSSVNIASQSAIEAGITYGKESTSVTAKQIGPESNLPAGKELSIKGQDASSYSAKVDSAFSGGTSKDVTVVTDEDQKKLLAEATSNLRKNASSELQTKLDGDLKVLEEALVENITQKTYSKNINDQASEFNLNLAVKYSGTAYSDIDLKTMISKLVSTNVPAGYQLNLTETETQAEVSRLEKDGRLIFAAKFKAKLMPNISSEKVSKDISFKTPIEAAEIIKRIENVISSEIKINPSLPGVLQRLPLLPQNISVQIKAK